MHLLQDASHALLGFLLLPHLNLLASWNRSLLVPLFQFLVSDEVLRHDARDLFEVIEDSQPRIFCGTLRWAELAIVVG